MQDDQTRTQLSPGNGWEQEMSTILRHMLPEETNRSKIDFRSYLLILWRRKWFVIVPLLSLTTLVSLFILLEKPAYEATATLLIKASNPKIINFDEVVEPDDSTDYFRTQYMLLQHPALVGRVIDELQSEINPSSREEGFSVKIFQYINHKLLSIRQLFNLRGADYPYSPSEIERHHKINQLMKSINISPVHGTRLVRVTISGTDPYKITTQVNYLVKIFIDQNLKNKLEASKNASSWLKTESSILRQDLHDTELALAHFIETRKFTPKNLSQDRIKATGRLDDSDTAGIDSILTSTKIQRVELDHQIEELKQLLELIPKREHLILSEIENTNIKHLQQAYIEIQKNLAILSEKLKDNHPKIKSIRKNRELIKRKIIKSIEDYTKRLEFLKQIYQNKEISIKRILDEEFKKNLTVNRDTVELELLRQDIDNKRELYENILRRLNETEITQNLESNNITITQNASLPIEPISSKKPIKLAAGFFLALFSGIGMALLSENFNKKFNTPNEAEQYLNIPFLGTIPHDNHQHSRNLDQLTTLQSSYSHLSNSHRTLRTSIEFLSKYQLTKILLITSSIPGEGKSTTAANLGLSFSQLGKSVLLIDATFLHPALHKIFDLENNYGLSDILIDNISWEQVVQNTFVDNVNVITSGFCPHNPVELLSMQRMKALCTRLKNYFDIIIFDTCSLLISPDASVLSSVSDVTLLVHNPTLGNREMMLETKQILENTQVSTLGFIFNNVKDTIFSHDLFFYQDRKALKLSRKKEDIQTSKDNFKIPEHQFAINHLNNKKNTILPIKNDTRCHDFSITIHKVKTCENLDYAETEEGMIFLILDIELHNNSSLPHTFELSRALLKPIEHHRYSNAVILLFGEESQKTYQESEYIPVCYHVNNNPQGFLKELEIVDFNETVFGKILYKVHPKYNTYMLIYQNKDIEIIVPFTI